MVEVSHIETLNKGRVLRLYREMRDKIEKLMMLRWFRVQGNENLEENKLLQSLISVATAREYRALMKSETDELTGLYNRKALNEILTSNIEHMKRSGGALILYIIDLDNFKEINDKHGHPQGDLALVYLAKLFLSVTRPYDTVARIGGDEFAILQVVETSKETHHTIASRLDKAFQNLKSSQPNLKNLGTSIGMAMLSSDDLITAGELFERADIAMYDSKAQAGDKDNVRVTNWVCGMTYPDTPSNR